MKKIILFTVAILTANLLFAQIINIPDDYPTIQQGINAANEGDTVLVHPGTYFENISMWLPHVTLASLFLTTGDTSYISQTIIDGNQEESVIIIHTLGTSLLTISGFTIQNGHTGDNSWFDSGGGIQYLESLYFDDHDTIQLQNLVIKDNVANNFGGGIYLYCDQYDSLSCISIREVVVQNNEAHGDDLRGGGGIYCENLDPKMENIIMKGNTAHTCFGGGAYFLNSNPIIQNCVISENFSTLMCTIGLGGGLYFENSNPLIQNTMINDNLPDGIYCEYSNLNIQNASVIANSREGLESVLSNSIITNSIFWGNYSEQWVYQMDLTGSSTATISYSDIQGGQSGIDGVDTLNWLDGNIDEDPLFEGSGDHPYQLSAGSPCIDAGTPDTTGLNLPDGDILGNERIWDGDNNGSEIIDMGAYEFGAVAVGIEKPIDKPSRFEVSMYPNPVSENCYLEFDLPFVEPLTVQVYNSVGKLIDETGNNVLQSGSNQVKVNMANLPEGIYFVKLQIGNDIVTKKIIKVH